MIARTNLVLPWRVEKCVAEQEVGICYKFWCWSAILWGTGLLWPSVPTHTGKFFTHFPSFPKLSLGKHGRALHMCQSAAAIGTNMPPAPYSEALIVLGMCGRSSGLEQEEPALHWCLCSRRITSDAPLPGRVTALLYLWLQLKSGFQFSFKTQDRLNSG